MNAKVTSLAAVARALPYVGGESRRYKAEPTQLSQLAARVMCASGAFTSEGQETHFRFGRILGALALLLAAGTLAVAGDGRRVDKQAWIAQAQLAQSDTLFSLGVGDYVEPPAAAAAPQLSAQDRFEIDRFLRQGAAN